MQGRSTLFIPPGQAAGSGMPSSNRVAMGSSGTGGAPAGGAGGGGLFIPPQSTSSLPAMDPYAAAAAAHHVDPHAYGMMHMPHGVYPVPGATAYPLQVPPGSWFPMASAPVDPMMQCAPAAVAFDCTHELTWSGLNDGRLVSHLWPSMERHTTWKAHDQEIKRILTNSDRLVSASPDSIRTWSRGGMRLSHFGDGKLHGLETIEWYEGAHASPQSQLLLGCANESISLFDVERNMKRTEVEVGQIPTSIKSTPRLILVGGSDGSLSVHDPRSLRVARTLDAHPLGMADMDVKGNLLVSCGYNQRGHTNYADPMIKVWDVRAMRASRPLLFAPGPRFLSFLPMFSATLMIVSQTGQMQVCDLQGADPDNMYLQAEIAGDAVMSCAVSSSGHGMMLGDVGGYVHWWANRTDATVNMYSHEVDRAPFTRLQRPPFTEETPFSAFPLPQRTSERLASDWPSHLYVPVPHCNLVVAGEPPVDPESIKWHDFVGTVAVPRSYGLRRYQTFRNTRPRRFRPQHAPSTPTTPESRVVHATPKKPMQIKPHPKYQRKNIYYSKLGVDGFDFAKYNRTTLSGLENTLAMSFANAAVQMLFFMPHIRVHLMNHLCEREFCIACELGRLFHMLELGQGRVCDPSNFLRCLSQLPEAHRLCLTAPDELPKEPMHGIRLVSVCTRFLLQRISHETAAMPSDTCNTSASKASSAATAAAASNAVVSATAEKSGEGVADATTASASATTDFKSSTPRLPKVASRPSLSLSSLMAGASFDEAPAAHAADASTDTSPEGITLGLSISPRTRNAAWLSDLMGIHVGKESTCLSCGLTEAGSAHRLGATLTYDEASGMHKPSFASVLRTSLQWTRQRNTWCSACTSIRPCRVRQWVIRMPDVLLIYSGLDSARLWSKQQQQQKKDGKGGKGSGGDGTTSLRMGDNDDIDGDDGVDVDHAGGSDGAECPWADLWDSGSPSSSGSFSMAGRSTAWVPQKISIKPSEATQEIHVKEYSSSASMTTTPDEHTQLFNLSCVVSHIHNPSRPTVGHGVAHVKVNHMHTDDVRGRGWYLFNDFNVQATSTADSVNFPRPIKHCVCLMYQRQGMLEQRPLPERVCPITRDILQEPNPLADLRLKPLVDAAVLTPMPKHLIPKAGDLVAIDSEFVALEPALTRIKASGDKVTIRPLHLALARVSVLTATEEAIIDDYIVARRPVYDYLTRWSGIRPGDLNPTTSPHSVTTLKHAYLKLRYLVDAGCIFVGHGLAKDFRILNLSVPLHQVRDTVNLFHAPRRRKISLRFLASYLLGLNIQGTTHDSIEDAVTALRVYREYERLREEGSFSNVLATIYQRGHACKWDPSGLSSDEAADEGQSGSTARRGAKEADGTATAAVAPVTSSGGTGVANGAVGGMGETRPSGVPCELIDDDVDLLAVLPVVELKDDVEDEGDVEGDDDDDDDDDDEDE